MTRQRLLWLLLSFAFGAALVAIWQLAAESRWVSPIYMPAPDRAWAALVNGLIGGDLLRMLLRTLLHMFLGWLIASLLGVAVGSAIGMSRVARQYVAPMLEFFRPLPASAMFPVAIAFFGLSEGMVLLVIAFGAIWPTLLATIHGFASVEPRLYEVARALDLSRWSTIAKIALPNAAPDVLAGMRLSLTVSLILAVTGEILASSDGLGLWVLLKARAFRSDDLFAGVILLGLVGYLSAQALSLLELRLLRWRTIG